MELPESNNAIQMAEAQHIGYGQSRTTLEDRSATRLVKTKGGLSLYIGIVADGMGGTSAGEAAGQLTVDTILQVIEEATDTNINVIIHRAIAEAHKAVVKASRTNVKFRSMGTTVTVAAIHGDKLYLGHVGDSRAYLVRQGKLKCLTMDHSWGNERVRAGQFTLEEVADHGRRDHLERYIGAPIKLEIDIGVRLDDLNPATSRLTELLQLQSGDVVMLCTDGLVKERPGGTGHYVEEAEVINAIERNAPVDAANTLVSMALGRQVNDNVSVIVIETPGKKRKIMPSVGVSPAMLIGGIGGAAALILVAIIVVLLLLGDTKTEEEEPTEFVELPTATMPVVEAGSLLIDSDQGSGYYITEPGSASQPLKHDSTIPVKEGTQINVTDGVVKVMSFGMVMYLSGADGETQIRYLQLDEDQPNRAAVNGLVILLDNGRLLIDQFQGITFIQIPDGNSAMAEGRSLFAVEVRGMNGFFLDCFNGVCQVLNVLGQPLATINPRFSVEVVNGAIVGEVFPANSRARWWQGVIDPQEFSGYFTWSLATETPTITSTATVNTAGTATFEAQKTQQCSTLEARGTPCPTSVSGP